MSPVASAAVGHISKLGQDQLKLWRVVIFSLLIVVRILSLHGHHLLSEDLVTPGGPRSHFKQAKQDD